MKNKTHLASIKYLALFLLLPAMMVAQNNFTVIKGSVVDKETNEDVSGATISINDTNISTVSNADGDFSLKVPVAYTSVSLLVRALGYKNALLDVTDANKDIEVALSKKTLDLDEIEVIAYKNARKLVDKVFEKKKENYLTDNVKMTAFYRETIKKRNRNASLAEAVVSIDKQSYGNSRDDDIKLIKSRKNSDYSRLDTIALKLQGGPFSTLYVDLIKYPEYIFTPETIEAYNFTFNTPTELNGRDVLVVEFEPKPNLNGPLYEGQLYISPKTLALQKAIFDLDLTNEAEVNKLFVKKKPNGVRIKPRNISYEVDYREKDGKWYYGYSKANLSFEVKKKRKLFKSIYTLSCEMAVTDWKVATIPSVKDGSSITPSIIMADQNFGFADPDFWGEYNVIEPDKSIESAIKKIQKSLENDDSYRASASLGAN